MAKSKIQEKVIRNHSFKVEGELDLSKLSEGVILAELEEEGTIDLTSFIQKFDGKYITISIQEKIEEEVE